MRPLTTRIQGPIAVIGDVHGQVDQLEVILRRLKGTPDWQSRWIVFIGDLVDRGPNPAKAVQTMIDLCREHPRTTGIMGNHEFAMAAALGWIPTPDFANWNDRWLDHYDADKTFDSYGARFGDLADLAEKVPADHRDLISGLPWCVEHPELLFVHAGLDPNQPFAVQLRILQQKDFSLTRPVWLCAKNLVDAPAPNDCPVIVVSGHVQVPEVRLGPNRLLVDTTGGFGGVMSCVLMPEQKVITSEGEILDLSEPEAEPRAWWKFW